MDALEAMDLAHSEFERRLRSVTDEQWSWPTPCAEWNVLDLVNHLVAGAQMYVRLLDGCTREESLPYFTANVLVDDDPIASFTTNSARLSAAFRRPGALQRECHHAARDMTGTDLLRARVGDVTIHTWDLARAVSADEKLDERLVQAAWDRIGSLDPAYLASTGWFGTSASGDVDDSYPLQIRLLDA